MRLVEDDRLHLPVYLYVVLASTMAAGIYTLVMQIPRLEDLYWPLLWLAAFLAGVLFGSGFWMLVLRHFLRIFGLHNRMPRGADEVRIARHVRPDFSSDRPLLFVARYFVSFSLLLLYAIEQAEASVIRAASWGRRRHDDFDANRFTGRS